MFFSTFVNKFHCRYDVLSLCVSVLFNMVQFSNTACNSSSGEQGICYTSTECDAKGMGGNANCVDLGHPPLCCNLELVKLK
jgi:hypothetical protein